MNSSEIKSTVTEIRTAISKNKKLTDFSKKYPLFVEKYPVLYDMCIQETFDNDVFNYVLQKFIDVENNKVDVEDAAKTIDETLLAKYSTPISK